MTGKRKVCVNGMGEVHLWTAPPLAFNRAEIMRYAGWPGGGDPACGAVPAEELLAAAAEIRCRAVWRRYAVRREADGTLDLGFARTCSVTLARFLDGCGEIALFALTAGFGMDRIIARESVRSPLRGLLAHAVGAERAETACDALTEAVKQACPGLAAAGRFSPGYGDLPMSLQREIFAALDCARLLGMALSDEYIMTPSKSVTAVISLRKREGECDDPDGGTEKSAAEPVL